MQFLKINCVYFFPPSLSEPVLKAQSLISSINRTVDWGYKHHKVTLGQLFTRGLPVHLLPQSAAFPRRCWRAQPRVPLPWIPAFCWCVRRLGHRSRLFSSVEWKGCCVPLCCLGKTNPALIMCHRAACPDPEPSLFSLLRRVSLPGPCSSPAGSRLAGSKHSSWQP